MRFRCHHPLPGSKRFFRTGNARVAVLMGSRKPASPSLDLNFLKGPAFARASVGTYFDSLGTLQSAAVNIPRYNFTGTGAGGVTNWVRNSVLAGSVPGGASPTNVVLGPPTGLSTSIIGSGTETFPYVDIRFFGTATSTGGIIQIDATGIPGSNGQVWTNSLYLRLVGGTLTNVTSFNVAASMRTAANGFIAADLVGSNFLPTAAALPFQRFSATATLNQPTTAIMQPRLNFTVVAGAIDFTIRIGAPQSELGTVANAWVSTSGAAVTTPVITPTLLMEPAATNSIRNNTMVGAAAGTPGTMPTFWNIPVVGAVLTTASVAGTGTENGIPYIDISLATASAGAFEVGFDNNLIPSSIGQTWTGSFFAKLIAGSNTNVTHRCQLYETGGVLGASSTIFTPTGAGLATQFLSVTRTNVQVGTTSQTFRYNFATTGAAAWTLRIGAPQLELGAAATSLILTSSTVQTRAAESGVPLDPRITFTRASGGSYFDQTGTLQTAAANFPRIDYGPNQGSNWIRNSIMQGAGVGVTPTNWTISQPGSGLTVAIAGTGIDGATGYPYIDLAMTGTATAAISVGTGILLFDTSVGIPGFTGQTWTCAINAQIVSGTFNGTLQMDIAERDVVGGSLVTHFGPVLTPTATLQRLVNPGQLFTGGAATQHAFPLFRWSCASGTVTNWTLRISAPQLELSAVPNPYVPTSGAARNTSPNPLGLLIEEARTNSIRNPRCEGAVVGTPGTYPTNWSQSQNTGIIPSVIGSGVESGIPYVDLRFVGTGVGGTNNNLFFEGTIAAGPSQTWTQSIYLRLVAGSWVGVPNVYWINGDNVATVLAGGAPPLFPTSAPLATQRFSSSFVTNAGAVTGVKQGVLFAPSVGAAIDFTLRIGAPQLELGAFATSLILPVVGTPAASSRATEGATMPVVVPATGFSLAVAGMEPALSTGIAVPAQLDDGAAVNRALIYLSTSSIAGFVSPTSNWSLGAINTAGAAYRAALSVKANSNVVVANGGNPNAAVTPSAVQPPGLNTLRLGSSLGVQFYSGYINRVRVWPRVLPPPELRANTL